MRKNLSLIWPLVYFSIWFYVLSFLNKFPEPKSEALDFGSDPMGTTALILVGSIYSIFIVFFLCSISSSEKPIKKLASVMLSLAIVWPVVVFVSIILGAAVFLIIGNIIGLLSFNSMEVPIITMFLTTSMGTYLFLSTLSKWNGFPKINIKSSYLGFSLITSSLSVLFIQTSSSFLGPDSFIANINLILISLVWQIIMTCYLWYKLSNQETIVLETPILNPVTDDTPKESQGGNNFIEILLILIIIVLAVPAVVFFLNPLFMSK